MQMSKISGCEVTNCSYNQNRQCHTPAITVGSPEDCACCDTFIGTSQKGGGADIIGAVGACKVDSCQFNQSLECSAPGINVGLHQGHADCTTFRRR